ncbi:MAG: PAS domain-containing protein [Myxococcales bacterium FL481]|nr:MAG: PAS domain-containing protein [Myxococcales bacterium FL481]
MSHSTTDLPPPAPNSAPALPVDLSVLGERLASGFAVLDARGWITYANDLLCRLLQFPRSALLESIAHHRPPYDPSQYQACLADTAKHTRGVLMNWRTYTNCELRLVVWPFPLFGPAGESIGSFALIEPATPSTTASSPSALVDSQLPDDLGSPALSPREREILQALVEGKSLDQAAATFRISPHTVRNHRKRIYRKLDIRSEAELLRLLFLGRPRATPD